MIFLELFDRLSILSLVIRRGNDAARRGIRTSQKIGLVPVLRENRNNCLTSQKRFPLISI